MRAVLIYAAGVFDIAVVVFHLLFWRLFRWPKSLLASGKLNVAITQTLNIMLTYVFAVYAGAVLMQGGATSNALLLSAVGFGVLRIVLQFRLFGMGGHLSPAFTLVMLFGTLLHLIPTLIGA